VGPGVGRTNRAARVPMIVEKKIRKK